MFIDTHCHISREYYNNIDLIINDNKKQNVNVMIVSGCEKESIKETLGLINKYSCLFATIGYHPDQVNKINDNDLIDLEETIKSNDKIIGIGEIGLDYHYDQNIKEEQKKLFEKQLQIAERLALPVIIHSRDATKDTIDILKKYKLKGIIHCFSGSLETAKIYIDMGYKLGIGGVITFKNSNLYKVVEQISIKDIVLETDSPYLSPEPYRGTTNSSKNIPIIAKKIAETKEITLEEVENITTQNCSYLFDLEY